MEPGQSDRLTLARAFPLMPAQRIDAELDFMHRHGIDVLDRTTDGWPARLSGCFDAPAALFRLGRCPLDLPHTVAIVGTRRATVTGTDFTRRLVLDLADRLDGLCIISGLAYGIDVAAHQAALEAGVPTIAVVAHGLNTIYPAEHRDVARRIVQQGGAIVSEYVSGTPGRRGNFLDRNRIVAGLSDVTVVAESAQHGGSLVTARHALRYGRKVVAAPYRWNDAAGRGCNELIASGNARMILDAEGLMDIAGWTECAKARAEAARLDLATPVLTPEMKRITDRLRQSPDDTLSELSQVLQMPVNELSALLMEMEMDDLLTALPGSRYKLNF